MPVTLGKVKYFMEGGRIRRKNKSSIKNRSR